MNTRPQLETDTPQTLAGHTVTVQDVSYTYPGARRPVLSNLTLTLAPREFIVLTGPSGAGKTTLLTLIGAIRALQQGRISVLGKELGGRNAAEQCEIRRKIGFIFQEHNLLSALTAFHNLWLVTELAEQPPSRLAAEMRATELLERLQVAEYLHSLPRELSTGQKQRVAVVRALMNTPQLILADEPTASLDAESSMLVIDLIRAEVARRGASALVVTHDERIFDRADRVLRLEDGRLADAR